MSYLYFLLIDSVKQSFLILDSEQHEKAVSLLNLMTVADVATILKLGKVTVLKYIREGRLQGYKIGGAYRIYQDDFEAFVKGGHAE